MAERLAPRRPETDPTTRRREEGRPRDPSRRPRSGLSTPLGLIAWGFGGLVALLVGAGAIVMVIGPSALIRDQLIAEVRSRTGRDLVIKGETRFTLFPSVGVTLGDVSLSARPGMQAPPTVVAKALDVSVAALPLLSSRIVVERLVLREPVIDLRVDRSGRRSWQFAAGQGDAETAAGRPVRLAQAGKAQPIPAELDAFIKGSTQKPAAQPSAAGPQASAFAVALDQLSFGDVRVEAGTVTYADQRSGFAEQVTALNATFAIKALTEPASAEGNLVARGERLQFNIRLTTPDKLIQGAPVKLQFDVKGRPAATTFDGTLAMARGFDGDGDLTIEAPSLPAVLKLAGLEVPNAIGFGGLSVAGRLRATETSVALSAATVQVDRTDLAGSVAVDFAAQRPAIRANLTSPEIDVDRVQAMISAIGAAKPVARAGAGDPSRGPDAPTAARSTPPRTITDLLSDPAGEAPAAAPAKGARVKGSTQRGGWSEQPFEAAALGLVDVDAKLTLGRLVQQSFKAGRTQASILLKSRNLRVVVDDTQLYDGRGRGIVSLDATTPDVGLGANLTVEGVAAQPLLKDLALGDGLAGRARLVLAVAGRGQSERQLVETLTGKADLAVADGALIGYNIPQIIRALGQLKFSGIDRTATEKTDFSELAATFAISNGLARTEDLRMASPLLRVAGAGVVNLPDRMLDLKLRPKLVGTLAGQGGESALTGVELPVRLAGPWDRPKVEFDQAAVGDILKDPNKAVDAAKEIGRQLKGKNADEIVRGVLGGATGEPGQVNPGKLLEKLFKN
jgi:AsmA protein